MTEIVPSDAIEGEVLTDDCALGYRGCTNTNVALVEDPYEADVNDTPGVLVMACPSCLQERCDDI